MVARRDCDDDYRCDRGLLRFAKLTEAGGGLCCTGYYRVHADAVFGFTAEAFCYFFPGIFIAGISESRPDLLINASLIQMLDRSNVRSSWDEFFAARWATLTPPECEAAQQWILWLADALPPGTFEGVLTRALQTLDIIKRQGAAVPFASR